MELETNELERVRQHIRALGQRDWLWGSLAVLVLLVIAGGLLGVFWLQSESAQEVLNLTRGQLTTLLYTMAVIVAGFYVNLLLRNRELFRARTELMLETFQGEVTRLQGMMDPLTRVFNRQVLEELLSKWITRSERYEEALSLVVVDIDNLKQINDKYGHLTGDFVLSEMGQILRTSVRGSDLVIRYGGDEFILVLSETDLPGAQSVVDRVNRLIVSWNAKHKAAPYHLGISMGISFFAKGKTAAQMVAEADRKMYVAKQKHRLETGVTSARA